MGFIDIVSIVDIRVYKDAIDMNSNKFAWYTVFWFAVTMTGLIVTCIFYF